MILIAHRGNINGPVKSEENKIDYIDKALSLGYDVEVDVWYLKEKFYLGHDKPEYIVSKKYLRNKKIWCHAKNINALSILVDINPNCFFHQNDDVVLTKSNYLWTYPGKDVFYNSIIVMPEKFSYNFKNVAGICSDFIGDYK